MYSVESSSLNGIDAVTVRMFQQLQKMIPTLQVVGNDEGLETIVGDIWCSAYLNMRNFKAEAIVQPLFFNKAYQRFLEKTAGNKLLATLMTIQIIEDFINDKKQDFLTLEESLQSVLKNHEQVGSLIKGLSASMKNSVKMPFDAQVSLALALKNSTKMQEVAYWANFFKVTAKNKRSIKPYKTIIKSGIKQSAKLDRLLPIEYLKSESPEAALDFIHRLADAKVKTFDYKNRKMQHKGQLIVCFDESGSMKELDSQGKGFLLALLSIAQRDKRDFIFIPFSSEVDNKEVKYFPKGRFTSKQLIELVISYSGGGTNFTAPLKTALDFMKESDKNGDLLFITDGISHLESAFIDEFSLVKNKLDFHMTSLIIGVNKHEGLLPNISDSVIKINKFYDKAANGLFDL